WFCVGNPDEFPVGSARAIYYLERHLVAWRSDDGALHVQDAFCPHLGAHLGHGGKVKGDCIECPFHGWTFDGDGANTNIPYSERTNKKAHLRSFPVVERNGLSMIWYHPDETVAPMWDVPEFPEFSGDPDWTFVLSTSYEVGTT